MTAPPPPSIPTSAQLAELAHRTTAELEGPCLVHLRLDHHAEAVDLGVGPILGDGHPADRLVGLRAPATWDAVGISTSGRVHDLSGAAPADRGRFTTLTFRDRPGATVIERADGATETLDGDPEGWVVDVLRRVLGVPAAPPDGTTALLIDVWWLDALVHDVLAHPGRCHAWRWMARTHPLCPPGTVPDPEDLAARAAAEAEARPWRALRGLMTHGDLPAVEAGIPDGTLLPGCDWFDDGTLCRWILRTSHPPDVLLGELIERLPAHLIDRLLAGLAEVDLGAIAA